MLLKSYQDQLEQASTDKLWPTIFRNFPPFIQLKPTLEVFMEFSGHKIIRTPLKHQTRSDVSHVQLFVWRTLWRDSLSNGRTCSFHHRRNVSQLLWTYFLLSKELDLTGLNKFILQIQCRKKKTDNERTRTLFWCLFLVALCKSHFVYMIFLGEGGKGAYVLQPTDWLYWLMVWKEWWDRLKYWSAGTLNSFILTVKI